MKNIKSTFQTKIVRFAVIIALALLSFSLTACSSGNFGDSTPDTGAATYVACNIIGITGTCP